VTGSSRGDGGSWNNKAVIAPLVVLALCVTIGVEGVGAIGAFVIAILAAVIGRRHGSFADLGFRRPASWPRLLATTLAYGVILQLVFLAVIEPLLGYWTGVPVDVSAFDAVRGNFTNFLILLAIGWVVGGFLEEFAFRGFIVGRTRWLLGSGTVATWAAVFIAAVPFGLAHAYQGVTGMITTGLTGFVLGAVFVRHGFNIWYAVFTHGFTNTIGILAIYISFDRWLGSLLAV